MPLSEELQAQIIGAIRSKIGRIRNCPVCGNHQFSLAAELFNMRLDDSPYPMPASSFAPATTATHVVLYCTKCGNANLLNVNVLGIMHLIQPLPAPLPWEESDDLFPGQLGRQP